MVVFSGATVVSTLEDEDDALRVVSDYRGKPAIHRCGTSDKRDELYCSAWPSRGDLLPKMAICTDRARILAIPETHELGMSQMIGPDPLQKLNLCHHTVSRPPPRAARVCAVLSAASKRKALTGSARSGGPRQWSSDGYGFKADPGWNPDLSRRCRC